MHQQYKVICEKPDGGRKYALVIEAATQFDASSMAQQMLGDKAKIIEISPLCDFITSVRRN